MNHNHDVDIVKVDDGEYSVACVHCGQIFYSKRSDAAFCSTRCRVAWSRQPQKKANAIEHLKRQKQEVLRIAEKYRRSNDVFTAMQELEKAIKSALGYFEV